MNNLIENRKRRVKFILDILGFSLINSAECENWKHYQEKQTKNHQPCFKNECQIVKTLAKKFDCNHFYTSTDNFISILNKFEIKSVNIRYCYSNNNNTIIIFQGGNPNFVDLVYYEQKYILYVECKDKIGRTKDYDLSYNEKGKIINYDNVVSEVPTYKPIIEKFNNETSIFEILGHNYKIHGTGEMLSNYFSNKKIDILIMIKRNVLYVIDVIIDLNFLEICKNSEIRSCGRNSYNLFTPKHFQNYFDINKITTSSPRMGNKEIINKYKSNKIYYVRNKEDFLPTPNLNKIKQNKASICIHFTINKNINELRTYYKSLNL